MTKPKVVSQGARRATITGYDANDNPIIKAVQYDELNGYNWRITCHGIAGGLPDIRTVNSVHSGIEFLVSILSRGAIAYATDLLEEDQ